MLTKYILTIRAAVHEVPDECLKNWNEISFLLKRTSYSGVMRSFSSSFVFVGRLRELLLAEYMDNGFNASAEISVHTLTDTHEWALRFATPLDFSSLSDEDGKLTINAIDNTLSALIKSKKGQKYEFRLDELPYNRVEVNRLQLRNSASYTLTYNDGREQSDWVDMTKDESSAIISDGYYKLYDEIAVARQDYPVNSFFAKVVARGADLNISLESTVLCRFWDDGVPSVGSIKLTRLYEQEGENVREVLEHILDNDITSRQVNGRTVSAIVGRSRNAVYASFAAMERAAGELFEGKFGIVGSNRVVGSAGYLDNNTIYEFDGMFWVNKGAPRGYTQRRHIYREVNLQWGNLFIDDYLSLTIIGTLELYGGTVNLSWADRLENTLSVKAVRPLALANSLSQAICPGSTVVIDADSAGLLADTFIISGESLRNIPGAKVYTTFQQFADWMEAVFGYTYMAEGDTLRFMHRSDAFNSDHVKVIDEVSGVRYSVNDDLIYSSVDVGYSKKEYGEIDGRFETNFTNYYSTEYALTDRKLSLISKYRSDAYGIEFTIRKGESSTKDDKADEDVFFVLAPVVGYENVYDVGNNDAFKPAVCVANNSSFIAAMGNGKAVALTMTSSDGNNPLEDVVISAGTALFSAGVLEFTTDDMCEPSDLDGLVQLDHDGFRYTGFIDEVEARYGRENGFSYKLIVKDITTL